MKALSIKQPWASLIAHGIKDIENRTWKTNFRGRIYIHASAKIVDVDFTKEQINQLENKGITICGAGYPLELRITSAIIGEVDIVDCVINHDSIWADKMDNHLYANESLHIYNWVLANPVLYDKPILNVKGKLSFWEFNLGSIKGIQCYNKPFVGGYFSPFKDGNCQILKLVKEDEQYYYFEDLSKYSKDLPWWWFQREKPIEVIEKNEPFIFPYESYSLWSRQLAKDCTVEELQKVLKKCEGLTEKYAKQHLSAIESSTSMQSQSQRRAHSRNNLHGNYEKKMAYSNAIELHKYYPERCKRSV